MDYINFLIDLLLHCSAIAGFIYAVLRIIVFRNIYDDLRLLNILLPVKIKPEEKPSVIRKKRILNFLLRFTYFSLIFMWIIIIIVNLFNVI